MRKKKKRFSDRLIAALPARMRVAFEWTRRLLEHDPLTEMTRAQRIVSRNIRVFFLVARLEVLRNLKLHAQALTYATLLSMVPALAVAFAVVKGFGGTNGITNRLMDFIVANMASTPELQASMQEQFATFIGSIDAGHIGLPSIVILIWSVLMLLGHIESSFNDIFGIREQRSFGTRMLTYWAVLTFGPVLLVASLALSAWFRTSTMASFAEELGQISAFFFSALPLFVTWIGFTAMYLFVPNTRVRLSSALFAAMIAGSLWTGAKLLYAFYASNAITLQNIYGSLAVIPLFIVWLYVSWLLVLFGAQLAFAFQNAKTYRREDEQVEAGHGFTERAVCRLYLEVARDFFAGRPASNTEQLTAKLRIPRRVIQDMLAQLRQGGFVQTTEPDGGLVPATDLEKITVADLLAHLRKGKALDPALVADDARIYIDELLAQVDKERNRITGDVSFRELAARFAPASTEAAAEKHRAKITDSAEIGDEPSLPSDVH